MSENPVKSSNKPPTQVKSVIVVSSKVDLKNGKETEIAATISIPTEGGWGWVVVVASLLNLFILDGIAFTFGTLINSIKDDFSITVSMAALVGSTETALYFIISPFASALINRYGFRVCVMTGSILCSISKLCTQFCTSYISLCLLYGWINGFGCAFVSMSSNLIVGFYFQRLRTVALIIASCGQSLGIMIMSPVNNYLVRLAGWRATVLLHSAMLGMIYFFGMVFKPVLSMTVMNIEDKNPESPSVVPTVTVLPNLDRTDGSPRNGEKPQTKGDRANVTERFFSAHSNMRFPTANKVTENTLSADFSLAPTTSNVSKLVLKINRPEEIRNHLSQMQSMISDLKKRNISINIIAPHDEDKKRGCCGRCCHWQKSVRESRPLYRDDAFYEGDIKALPAYQKSVTEIPPEKRTGLEYQLAVSRAVSMKDLKQKKALNAIAIKRVLASLFDPTLFRRLSFIFVCIGAFMTYLGLLVPIIFIPDKSALAGIEPIHCGFFLTVIGFFNTVGRLICTFLVKKIAPVNIQATALILTGLSTIISTISTDLYFQYGIWVVFGLTSSGIGGLRSVMLVSLYGLENLTNATGFMLIFIGLGNIISTPLAGALKQYLGYNVSFYLAGGLVTSSGFIFFVVWKLVAAENKLLHA